MKKMFPWWCAINHLPSHKYEVDKKCGNFTTLHVLDLVGTYLQKSRRRRGVAYKINCSLIGHFATVQLHITQQSRIYVMNLIVVQPLSKVAVFSGIRKFIAMYGYTSKPNEY